MREEYEFAIADYTQAIVIDPKNSDAFYNRGIVYSKRDQHQDAIRDFSKAISINPEDADSYMNRGIEKVIIGKKDDGCADIIEAANLGLVIAIAERNKFCGF